MAILQKNIWTIFYILLIGAFIFLGIVSFTKWESVHEKYTTDQVNLVKLVSNATHSLFLAQETTLNILGNQILKDKDPRVMDDLLTLNPSIVAFGFVDLDGNNKIEQTTSANDRKDMKVIGNSLPRYNYNFGISADWYGIDF